MIGNGAIGRILEGGVLLKDKASVRSNLGILLNLTEERLEDINVVVRGFVLKERYQPFQSHAGIDVLIGQSGKAGFVSVVLDEDNVPDFDNIWIVRINQG